jgi:hypothetical protein
MQKKQDLDDDLGLYINRFLDRGRDMKKLIQEYYDMLFTIQKDTNLNEEEKKIKLIQADSNYLPRFISLPTQDSDKIAALHTELTKKYGEEFNSLQKPTTSEKVIEGKWREGTSKFFRFNGDHSMLMTVDDKDYAGKWSLYNNILKFEFDDNSSVNYYIIYYGPGYIRFHVGNPDLERQLCRQ